MITTFSEISPLPSPTDISLCYFEACNSNRCTNTRTSKDRNHKHSLWSTCTISSIDALLVTFMAKKKYKPVTWKVWLILDTLPSLFCIKCNITGDPLADLPTLLPHPPPFTPCGCYTKEQCAKMDDLHSTDFLWPTKHKLLHHFVSLQNEGFTWDDSEHGHFCEDFFPPIEIPIVVHTPWVEWNIPIPPGINDEVCRIICVKIDAGVYEWSNSSYHSRWFCIIKKDMTSLHLIHSLELLNTVTIQHSGTMPFTEQIAEQFASYACGGILDLYVGYDEHVLTRSLCDYMTFQTPYSALHLTKLLMGWTNVVPVFHDDVTHILQPEVPKYTILYINDIPVCGPTSTYQNGDGVFETIPENSGICHFIWEHFQNVNQIVQHMKYSGGTFSGKKLLVCTHEITVVGHVCTPEGCVPDPVKVDKIDHWGPCTNLSKVHTFLGMVGVVCVFIKNFTCLTHPLTALTCKDVPFIFGLEQISAQDMLKTVLLTSPTLRPTNYASNSPVILGVDTSSIAVRYLLCQYDVDNPCICHYMRFGSITLNDCESCFSQP